jgi:hypothetical protein
VLRKRDVNFRLWSVPAPERRSVGAPSGSPSDEVRS